MRRFLPWDAGCWLTSLVRDGAAGWNRWRSAANVGWSLAGSTLTLRIATSAATLNIETVAATGILRPRSAARFRFDSDGSRPGMIRLRGAGPEARSGSTRTSSGGSARWWALWTPRSLRQDGPRPRRDHRPKHPAPAWKPSPVPFRPGPSSSAGSRYRTGAEVGDAQKGPFYGRAFRRS